jgi:hypothetical protein
MPRNLAIVAEGIDQAYCFNILSNTNYGVCYEFDFIEL